MAHPAELSMAYPAKLSLQMAYNVSTPDPIALLVLHDQDLVLHDRHNPPSQPGT